MSAEACVSCKAEPKARYNPDSGAQLDSVHPYVAVMHLADAPEGAEPVHEGQNARGKEYGAFPVCEACHEDPRRHPGLKAHFFERNIARVATALAGSDSGIGG